MSERTVVIGAFSDTHCGSTRGLIPKGGITLDDAGTYTPGREQRWVWDVWQAGWDHTARIIERERKISGDDVDFAFVSNGDATDGNHHGTPEIFTNLEGYHIRAAAECFRVPMSLGPRWCWIVRGTEAHVGKAGGLEEGLAVALSRDGAPVVRYDDGEHKTWSWWHPLLEFNGQVIEFTHHGRMGQRAHTRGSYSRLYAFDVWAERKLRDEEIPAIAMRSHCHLYEDSGPPHPTRPITRVIQMPCFQLMGAYARRKSIESLPDIGMVVVVIRPDGEIDVSPCVIAPQRAVKWKP